MLTFGNVYTHLYIPHRQFFQVYLWRCFISLAALYLWIDEVGYLKKNSVFCGVPEKNWVLKFICLAWSVIAAFSVLWSFIHIFHSLKFMSLAL